MTRGGSNLLCWDISTPGSLHGYIKEMNIPSFRTAITQQLQTMFNNGQRVLGLPICYYEGGDGLALDSTHGLQNPDKQNLADLVSLAQSIGFGEFLVEMVPEWSAAWNNWTNPTVMGNNHARVWQPREYARNFEFTCDVHDLLNSLGVAHRVDLLAEALGTYTLANPGLVEHCRRMIEDWYDQYPNDSTVCFSINATLDFDLAASIKKLWGSLRLPDIWAIHAYGNKPGQPTTTQLVSGIINQLVNAGLQQYGCVIGETYYDSQNVKAATQSTYPIPVWYWLQWPVTEATPDGQSQTVIPVDWEY